MKVKGDSSSDTQSKVTLNLFEGRRKISIQPGHIFHRLVGLGTSRDFLTDVLTLAKVFVKTYGHMQLREVLYQLSMLYLHPEICFIFLILKEVSCSSWPSLQYSST